MKRILFIISILISFTAYSQTTGFFRYDTIAFQKVGANSEFNLYNGTRNVTNGVLINTGGGRTSFSSIGVAKNSTRDSIIFTLGTLRIAVKDSVGSGGGSTNTSLGGGTPIAITGTNDVNSIAAGYNIGISSAGNLITIENRDTLYVLVSGQSNSNGFNDGLYDTARNTKVFGWNGSAWVILQRGVAPMGWCFPENSSGTCGGTIIEDSATSAGFYFAKRLQERTGKIIRVFFTGYGGEVISNWIPASSTNFAKMNSFLAATGNPHIDYFLWQHGEANGFDADTTYKRKFDTLVQQMDAQVWMGKDVPIFIATVRDTATHQTMYYTQIAMGSGLYDRRYTTIDAGKEPYYNPAPYHFSAEGEYNIANKLIATIYNKLSSPNALRGVTAAQQTTMETFVSSLGKPIITWDSTSKAINIQEINLLKTGITGGYLTLRELFDSYGAVDVNVRNSGNVTGLEIWNKGLDASGITFKTNTANEHRIVYQHDAGSILSGNTSGELQHFKPGVGNLFRVGEVNAGLQPNLYIGSAAVVPSHKLTVGGQVRITAINNVSTPDSALYIEDGVIKAGLASGGSATGWDDMAAVGQAQSTNRTITYGANSLDFVGTGTFSITGVSGGNTTVFSSLPGLTQMQTVNGTNTGQVAAAATSARLETTDGTNTSIVTAFGDSIVFNQNEGKYRFHLLPKGSIDTTTYKPAAWDINGRPMRMNSWAQVSGGGGSGVTTMAAIGSTPNANGATISGSTLNLEPANGSFGGVVTTSAQTMGAGVKTFTSQPVFSAGLGINGPYVNNVGMMLSYDGGSNLGGITLHNGSTYKDFRVAANTVSLYGNGATLGVAVNTNGNVGIGGVTSSGATGRLHIAAGTTAASTAPLKFTSGPLMTTAEAGAVEFLTDNFYGTITTGAARKEFTLNDITLTSGRVPFATTNGRLTDHTGLVYGSGSGLAVSTTSTGTVFSAGGTITPSAGSNGWITQLGGSITEAGSSTHPVLAGVSIFAPTITNGAGATTDATSLYISGPASGITPVNAATAFFIAAGNVRWAGYGAGTATFDATGNITSASDGRLKNIVGNYKAGLKEILKLHPIVYTWKKGSGMETTHQYAGLDAREVYKVFGELGSGANPEGYRTLQDRALIAALINSVKELSARVEKLESELNKSK